MQIHSSDFWLKSGLNENAIQSFEEELASLTTSETVESGYVGKPARSLVMSWTLATATDWYCVSTQSRLTTSISPAISICSL